jgi:hypothetical protein
MPLRHLITLIVDARHPPEADAQDRQKKDQFLRDLPDRSGLSLRVRATDPLSGTSDKPSLHDVSQRARPPLEEEARILVFRG